MAVSVVMGAREPTITTTSTMRMNQDSESSYGISNTASW
jgi:hypothetical protein